MEWTVKHVFNFTEAKQWGKGHCAFGFHGAAGTQYMLQFNQHWLGCLLPDDQFPWTAGAVDPGVSGTHIPVDIENPHFITELPDGSLIVSSNGTGELFKVRPEHGSVELFLSAQSVGMKDVGNCVYDQRGSIWVNEIEGCRIRRFDLAGNPLVVLGDGTPGFQTGTVPFERVRFNWIYDLRHGADGNLYVLDSKNFSVRRINVSDRTVTTMVGNGTPGYTGDGGDATHATLGGDSTEYFDGPFALSIDEQCNLFIGDSYNHVVRMVEYATNRISTIAGKHHADPRRRNDRSITDPRDLNLPMICSMDYHDSRLFVPDWSDDLIVLERKG